MLGKEFDRAREEQRYIEGLKNNIPSVLTKNQLDKVLIKDRDTIGFIWAPWCGPCRSVAGLILKLQDEGEMNVFQTNMDEGQEIGVMYGIRAVPAFCLYKGLDMVHKVSGAVTEEELRKAIKKYT